MFRLLAHPTVDWQRNDPVVFQRLDENGKLVEPQSNGFMLKFTVEHCSMHANDGADFATYLANANLCIDVWNADSLLPFGQVNIPLRVSMKLFEVDLLRHKNLFKKFKSYEFNC